MKTYLFFNIDGNVEELKTKAIKFTLMNFKEYDNYTQINYKMKNYIILSKLSDDFSDINKNISRIPFYNVKMNGAFSILQVNNFEEMTIETFTYTKYYRLLDNKDILYFDYSSDDFSPDTCDENNNC